MISRFTRLSPVWALFFVFIAAPAFAGNSRHEPDEQVLRAIHLSQHVLEVSQQAWLSGAHCYTCHHETMQFRTDRVASEHGVAIDRDAANANLLKTVPRVYAHGLSLLNVDSTLQGVQLTDAAVVPAVVLASVHDLGVPPTLSFEVMAERLTKLQRPDGYWETSDRRPPQIASRFTTTAYAIEGIRDYLPERVSTEKREVIARAKRWLLSAAPRDTEDEAMQLFGLNSAGASKQEIWPIAKRLIGEQRADGGWAQIRTRESDAYATGEVLVALYESGALHPSAPEYRRGLSYLLKTQAPDGSWHVKTRLLSPAVISPPPFDFKFPYEEDYVISYFGTTWAEEALISSLPRVRKPQRIYDASADEEALSDATPEPAWIETALFGSTAELKDLLRNGLSPNATTPGGTPLLQVVATDSEKVQLLLSMGADVNSRTKYGYSALSVAANFPGTADAVRLLLAHGARIERPEKDSKGDVDFKVPTPLFLAAGTGDIEVARLLIQHGDDPDAVWQNPLGSGSRRTTLSNAILMGDAAMVRLLIDSGASMGGNNEQAHYLRNAVLGDRRDVIAVLIEKGINVNATDESGLTALHYAAMTDYGDTDVVRQLLAAGAKPELKDKSGETAQDAATRLNLLHIGDALKANAR